MDELDNHVSPPKEDRDGDGDRDEFLPLGVAEGEAESDDNDSVNQVDHGDSIQNDPNDSSTAEDGGKEEMFVDCPDEMETSDTLQSFEDNEDVQDTQFEESSNAIKVQNLIAEIEQLRDMLAEKDRFAQEYEDEKAKFTKELARLERDHLELHSTLHMKDQQIDFLNTKFSEYNCFLSEATQLRACLAEIIPNLDFQDENEIIAIARNKLLELKRNEEYLYQNLRHLDGENRKLVEHIDKQRAMVENANAEIGRLNALVEQEKTRCANTKEKLNLAVTKGKSLVQHRDSLKQLLSEKKSQLENCSVELQEKSTALEAAEEKYKDLVAISENVETRLYITDQELRLHELILGEDIINRAKVDHLLNELETVINECNELKSEKVVLQENLEVMEEKSSLFREKLSMAVEKGKGLVQERENLKGALDEKNIEIDKLRTELQQKVLALDECLEKISKLSLESEMKIKLIEDVLSDAKGSISLLLEEKKQLEVAKRHIEDELKAATEESYSQKIKFEEVSAKRISVEDALLLAENNISKLINEKEVALQRSVLAEEELSVCSSKLVGAENTIKSLEEALVNAENKVANLVDGKKNAEGEILVLTSKLDVCMQELAGKHSKTEIQSQELSGHLNRLMLLLKDETLLSLQQQCFEKELESLKDMDVLLKEIEDCFLEVDLIVLQNSSVVEDDSSISNSQPSIVDNICTLEMVNGDVNAADGESILLHIENMVEGHRLKDKVLADKFEHISAVTNKSYGTLYKKLYSTKDRMMYMLEFIKSQKQKVKEFETEKQRMENKLEETKQTCDRIVEERDMYKERIVELETHKKARESMQEEMRLRQEDYQAKVDKLEEKEAELLSLYATTLSKVQESENCLVKLQEKSTALEAAEKYKDLLATNENMAASLRESLAEKDMIFQKCREMLSESNVIEEFQSTDLVEKLKSIVDERKKLKAMFMEYHRLGDSLSLFDFPETVLSSGLDTCIRWILDSFYQSKEEALEMKDEISRLESSPVGVEIFENVKTLLYIRDQELRLHELIVGQDMLDRTWVDRLLNECNTLKAEKAVLQENLEVLEGKSSLYREKLSMAVKKGKGLVQEREKLKGALDEKNAEIDKLRTELQQKVFILEECHDKISKLSSDIVATKESRDELLLLAENNMAKLTNEKEVALQRSALAEEELQRSKDELSLCSSKLVGAENTLKSLEEGLLNAENKMVNLVDEKKNAEQEILALNSKLDLYMQELAGKHGETEIQSLELSGHLNRLMLLLKDEKLLSLQQQRFAKKLESLKDMDILLKAMEDCFLEVDLDVPQNSSVPEDNSSISNIRPSIFDNIRTTEVVNGEVNAADGESTLLCIEKIVEGFHLKDKILVEKFEYISAVTDESYATLYKRLYLTKDRMMHMVEFINSLKQKVKQFETDKQRKELAIVEERDMYKERIVELETDKKARENMLDEMRLKQEDYEAKVDKLEKKEAELSSLYATTLFKVQELENSLLSVSETKILFNKINEIDVPETALVVGGDEPYDMVDVRKLFYIIDAFSKLQQMLNSLSREKEDLQSTLDKQVVEIENLKIREKESERMKNELLELDLGLQNILKKLGADELINDHKRTGSIFLVPMLDKLVTAMAIESENLRLKNDELDAKLNGSRNQARNPPSENGEEMTSEISQVQDMGMLGKSNNISPVPSAAHVRTARTSPSDNVVVDINSEFERLVNNEEAVEDKGHVFKSLGTSGLIPIHGRTFADRIDGIWVSGGRALMGRPRARLGVIAYCLFLHIWLLGTIL